VEGKESGFRSLESIWTEDGGSGGYRRGATGWAEPYKKKRVESERFFIGFYKMLINRMFSGVKVSPLHSILVLQLLHLLA
jgi:hypothetical protein